MSPRSIRRAAERKANKLARKEALQKIVEPFTDNQVTPELVPGPDERPSRAAGPKTPEGKSISCMNALKTGLTGRTVVLPSEDLAAFKEHVQAYFDEYKPQGLRERELVQSLAENRWRLNRSFALEAAIFSQAAAETEEGTPAPGNLENLLKYEKTLKNLHLQEARLHRRVDKDLAELRELQQIRMREELLQTNTANPAAIPGAKLGSNFQTLKELLELDGSKLPNASKCALNAFPIQSENQLERELNLA